MGKARSVFEKLFFGNPKRKLYSSVKRQVSAKSSNNPKVIGFLIFLGVGIRIYDKSPVLFYVILFLVVLGVFLNIFSSKKAENKKYENIKTIEEMKNLHWREFEKFIEFVLRKKGFKANVRQGRNDGGVDLDAELNGQKYLVQCKKRDEYKIGVTQLREFFGVVRMKGNDYKGIYIITGKLTQEAMNEYEKMEDTIELWDFSNLEEYVSEFKGLENEK